ncbi:MAG: hypothetical protein KGQ16_07735 [Cyanobacteria bacterium REEB444]|nr:hypothetical protein [Cyanobacteria bacterium REEB444]
MGKPSFMGVGASVRPQPGQWEMIHLPIRSPLSAGRVGILVLQVNEDVKGYKYG